MQKSLKHPVTFVQRIGIAFLIYFLCRICFFIFNVSYFSGFSPLIFFHGLRFDLSAITFFYLPFIFLSLLPFPSKSNAIYQRLLKFLFHLSNSVSILLNCIDIEYFKFTLKRTTSDLFALIGFGEDFVSLVPKFAIDFWYVIAIAVSLFLLSEWLYRKTEQSKTETEPERNAPASKFYVADTILFFLFTAIFIIAGRGGFQLRPLNIINANEYASSQNIPLVLNTPFTILKTFFYRGVEEKKFFEEKELNETFSPVHSITDSAESKDLNVVLIIMESFSNEYIGAMNPEIPRTTYTPFLDSLSEHSLLFDRCYANGRKSIEGIPAIVAALPTLMNNPYISSPYSTNKINSLASTLNKKGYSTAFFHGGTNGTMGFDLFAKAAGFQKYFGRYEYNNDEHYDGHWGIYDEEFFQYFLKNLDEFKEPFFGCFFSLSSHHPYSVPEKYKDDFKEGKHKIHRAIQYADFSLKKFFEGASKQNWFQNTLFIITSDHTSISSVPFFGTKAGIYSVPLMFYYKGILPKTDHRVTQQTDIMPSVLDFLNYDKNFVAFGQSVFSNRPGFSVSFMNNIYQIITDEYLLQHDGSQTISLYDFKNDLLLKNNILAEDSSVAFELEKKLKAIIQSYNYRLINNELSTD